MDSLTQAALGAGVGGLVLGPRAGWRGFAWGAAIGTLPDLDSFIDYGGPVANFTGHRGHTHALAVQTVCAPLIAWPLYRLHGRLSRFARWLAAVWLVLVTHALLDAVTIYGTRLGLPIFDEAVGLGSIFIIDPLFTLPLLLGMGAAAVHRDRPRRAAACNAVGLGLAGAYLLATAIAQASVEARAERAIAASEWTPQRILATPTPFNSIVWRIVAVGETSYWEGFYTLGTDRRIVFSRYPRHRELLDGLEDHPPVRRLRDFTDGFYTVAERAGRIVVTDLRMGQAEYYAFAFEVAVVRGHARDPITPRRYHYERPRLAAVVGALYDCARGRSSALMTC